MRVALYLRVSTSAQTVENQERELAAVAAARGWQVVETYRDEGISGAKGRDRRPGFDRLWKDAARRKFDVVAAWSVDRLGRSLADVATFMVDLQRIAVASAFIFMRKPSTRRLLAERRCCRWRACSLNLNAR